MSNVTTTTQINADALTDREDAFIAKFKSRVIGQDAACEVALDVYRVLTNPLRDKTRPIGVYYLVGPSRTGKSYTPETLAEILHGSKKAVTRIQMADYNNDAQILDIKGAPPMYVGYQDPAKLKLNPEDVDPTSLLSSHNLKRVRLNSKLPVDIIILEEFEKGNADIFKLFMGIFDKGELRLGNGQVVDLRSAVFFLTSNIGMDTLARKATAKKIGFIQNEAETAITPELIAQTVKEAMREQFKPEFINRMDMVAIYKPLDHDETVRIVDTEIEMVRERIAASLPAFKVFELEVSLEAKAYLANKAKENGGSIAELKRVMNRLVLNPLGREINQGKIAGASVVHVVVKDGALAFDIVDPSFELTTKAAETQVQPRGRLSLNKKTYKVTATAPSFEELSSIVGDAQHDLAEIYGIKWGVLTINRMQSPVSGPFMLKAMPTQMKNFANEYPEFEVVEVTDVASNPAA